MFWILLGYSISMIRVTGLVVLLGFDFLGSFSLLISFQFHHSIIGLLGIEFCYLFFYLLFIKLSRSYYLG
jgi:hypothetical protein